MIGLRAVLARVSPDDRRDYEQALQQFVGQSPWPADAVRDRLQRWLVKSRIVCKRSGLSYAATTPSRTFVPIA